MQCLYKAKSSIHCSVMVFVKIDVKVHEDALLSRSHEKNIFLLVLVED